MPFDENSPFHKLEIDELSGFFTIGLALIAGEEK
jgi:hypothetical protein